MTNDEIEKVLEEKRKQLKELQKQAAPINRKIYLLECEIYGLLEEKEDL
ncbi:hypothetical protein I6G77_04385 [Bacillus tropicus]|uniref:Transcriptional regulator n=1 Tax=Bacillus tropicus TaxID=2026188 RepID=A0A7T2V722_9BACI|nr:hypothetical protein [Bacillus tropicus]AJG91596.1 hypothetical protein BG03_2795 [Bacillus cereus]QPR78449.1 hypothetical protein I6G77_04385 [Bacillus tropicus]